MTAPTSLDPRLAGLRSAFDASFAARPSLRVEAFEDLLVVRFAGDPYVLRVREISGLVASRKVVPLPSLRSDLFGLAGIRGSVVPVHSLAVLLGYSADATPMSWLALAAAPDLNLLALGFEEFEGFVRVPSAEVTTAQMGDGARPHAHEMVRLGNQTRLVVDIPSTLQTIRTRTRLAGPTKER